MGAPERSGRRFPALPAGPALAVLAVVVLALAPAGAAGQLVVEPHVGWAVPMADYGSNNLGNDGAGRAVRGFAVGADVLLAVSDSLAVVLSADMIRNGVDEASGFPATQYTDVELGSHVLVPVMVGLRYDFIDLSPDIFAFVVGQAGWVHYQFFEASWVELAQPGVVHDAKVDPVSGFGYQFGAGVTLADRVDVTFRWRALGTFRITGQLTTDDGQPPSAIDLEKPVSLYTVMVGLRLP